MPDNKTTTLVGHNYTTPDLIAKVTGQILETSGSYVPVFIMAGFAYLIALAVIHVLAPRLDPVKLD